MLRAFFYIALVFLSKSTPRESYEIGDNTCFLIIEIFLEILIPNLQPRFDVELLFDLCRLRKTSL